MDQSQPAVANESGSQLRITQPCDVDCVCFEVLASLPDWGWCHDAGCTFRQGLVRPGRECPRYGPRPLATGR